jgi:hypothetical protein
MPIAEFSKVVGLNQVTGAIWSAVAESCSAGRRHRFGFHHQAGDNSSFNPKRRRRSSPCSLLCRTHSISEHPLIVGPSGAGGNKVSWQSGTRHSAPADRWASAGGASSIRNPAGGPVLWPIEWDLPSSCRTKRKQSHHCLTFRSVWRDLTHGPNKRERFS